MAEIDQRSGTSGDPPKVPVDSPAATSASVLTQMATQATASTKIIASWLVALATFGFFGFWQAHWKVVKEGPNVERLRGYIAAHKDVLAKRYPTQLHILRQANPAAFEPISTRIEIARGNANEANATRNIDIDLCDGLSVYVEEKPPVSGEDKRRFARAMCKSMDRVSQELKELEKRERESTDALKELPLKTPLFEAKVATFLAPMAQLALLAGAI